MRAAAVSQAAACSAAPQAARSAGCGELLLTAVPGQDDLRGFCLSTGFVEASESSPFA